MIGMRVEVAGGDVVIQKLHELPDSLKAIAIPETIRAALIEGHRAATAFLSGTRSKSYEKVPAGGYPVPVRTGFLRQSEGTVFPGQSKFGLTAGLMEGFLVNTSAYASVIAETRPFHDDAMPDENIPWYLDSEINRLKKAMAL